MAGEKKNVINIFFEKVVVDKGFVRGKGIQQAEGKQGQENAMNMSCITYFFSVGNAERNKTKVG